MTSVCMRLIFVSVISLYNLGVCAATATRLHSSTLKGHPGDGYCMDIYVGTPPQKISVLVDTGSSNLAIATVSHPFITRFFHPHKSSTYRSSGRQLDLPYTQGRWSGDLATDLISMATLSNVTAYFAGITKSEDFFVNDSQWQGILGLAYPSIAQPDSSETPLFDTFVQTGAVRNIFSMQLCGTLNRHYRDDRQVGGIITWGGLNESLYTGRIHYTPVVKEEYYEVTIADIHVGGRSLAMDCKEYNYQKTIVDSGTTNLRLSQKAFDKLTGVLRKTIMLPPGVSMTDFLSGDESVCWQEGHLHYSSFPNISLFLVHSHDSLFELTISPQQYLRHTDTPLAVIGDCFTFAISPSSSGTILGAVVMEAFYTVFDRENRRIGFALSTCQGRDPTKFIAAVDGPVPYKGNATDCAYSVHEPDRTALTIIGYVMAAVCGVCILPIVILCLQWQIRKRCSKSRHISDHTDLLESS